MIPPDEHRLFRDMLAEGRRDRDREREPRTSLLPRDHGIQALECPKCLAPVYAPGDSDGERIDCSECDAPLVTLQSEAGLVAVLLAEGTP